MFLSLLTVFAVAPLVLCQFGFAGRLNQQKQGDCPPRPNLEVCERTCYSDWNCERRQKCCGTACGGNTCLNPVTKARVWRNPGSCPKPSGPWVCTHRCRFDSDCGTKRKCCQNRCGALACIKPTLEDDNEIPNDF